MDSSGELDATAASVPRLGAGERAEMSRRLGIKLFRRGELKRSVLKRTSLIGVESEGTRDRSCERMKRGEVGSGYLWGNGGASRLSGVSVATGLRRAGGL